MTDPVFDRRTTTAGVLLGLGLGGFFDGIVLHQLLQWHHMVSHVSRYPTTTVAGLKANTVADGLFHAGTWVVTLAGIFLLWPALGRSSQSWPMRNLVGLLLIGWGMFNVIEGVIDHLILQVHHVKEQSDHRLFWDLAFLAWGLAMIVGGIYLARRSPALRTGHERATARPTS